MGIRCKHKYTHINLGWIQCTTCEEFLYAESTIRPKTFLDKDSVGTHKLVDM